MVRISKYLNDDVVTAAQDGIKTLGKSGFVARKLQYIVLAKEHGITNVCNFCSITKRSLIRWIKDLKGGSLKSLEIQKGRGRKSKISEEQGIKIKEYIVKNSNATIEEVRQYVLKTFAISLSKSTVYRMIKN